MQIMYLHIWLQGAVVARCLALSSHSKKAVALIPFDSLEVACIFFFFFAHRHFTHI